MRPDNAPEQGIFGPASQNAWSLKADFVMWWKMVTGTMDAEVERVAQANSAKASKDESPATAHTVDTTITSDAVN